MCGAATLVQSPAASWIVSVAQALERLIWFIFALNPVTNTGVIAAAVDGAWWPVANGNQEHFGLRGENWSSWDK